MSLRPTLRLELRNVYGHSSTGFGQRSSVWASPRAPREAGCALTPISGARLRAVHSRVVLGHPFNPPHLMPLVEVVGGRLTSEDAVKQALAFYGSIGKKPIHIRREVKGHLANRLQAALWREAFYLVEQRIASVEDVDTAIAYGPELRWALLGPFLNLHLSGGAGGIAHVLEHLGPPFESWWRDLGNVTLNEELNRAIARGVTEELGGADLAHLTSQRDDVLLALLQLKSACEAHVRRAMPASHSPVRSIKAKKAG